MSYKFYMDKLKISYEPPSEADELTILNILKSVGIDGRRDKNALL